MKEKKEKEKERFLYNLGDSKGIPSHIPNWHRVRAITKTTSLDRLRLVFSSTRRSYKPHAQTRVEPNSRNTFPRVKRSGSEIPIQGTTTHFTGRCSTRGRAGPLAGRHPRWTLREVHPESSTLVRFKSPHTPRHSRATDRRDRQIRKTRQLHGE